MIKLDIGCGEVVKDGFIGIDKRDMNSVTHIVNLNNERIPYNNETVDEIYSSHFLEHVYDVENVFLEIIRVVKVGGKIEIRVPFYSSPTNYVPTHIAFFNPFSFCFFTVGQSKFKNAPAYLKPIHKPKIRFNYFKDYRDIFLKPFEVFANNFTNLYLFSFAFIIPAHEIVFRFIKIKKFEIKRENGGK